MPDAIRVFVNDRGYSLPAGASVRDAVGAAVPELLSDCDAGRVTVSDARGLPVGLGDRVTAGSILRVRASRQGSAAPDDGR
jgi:hypothetical protein